jgi:hypothetical protein
MELKQCRELAKVKLKALKIDFRPNCVQNFTLFLTQSTMPPIIKSNQLDLYADIITVYCENHTKHNTLCGKMQFLRRCTPYKLV